VGELLVDEPELRLLGRAWSVASASGASLVDVLTGVADDLAARLEQADAVAAALAGPRSSAMLLAGLPVLGIALGSAMQARPVQFLLGDHLGRSVLLAGVALDAAGLLWTRRLARGGERP
jgi:tight adherence protein B